MERHLAEARGSGGRGEVEISSYVDDINGVICDWECTSDMKRVGERAAAIMEEVAAEWDLF